MEPPCDLNTLAQQVQTLVNAETAVVALSESGGERVHYAAGVGKHAAAIVGKRGATATSGLCGTVFQSDRSALVCQTEGDQRVRQDQVRALGITTALAVPVHYENRAIGVLMALNRRDQSQFDTTSESQLIAYANQVAAQVARFLNE